MSTETKLTWRKQEDGIGPEWEPTLTITVVGWHEVVRLMLGFKTLQCEFVRIGDSVLAQMKRKVGAPYYKRLVHFITGSERYT